jgi:hypothetical protein
MSHTSPAKRRRVTGSLAALPRPLLCVILSYLPSKQRIRVQTVSKDFLAASLSPYAWTTIEKMKDRRITDTLFSQFRTLPFTLKIEMEDSNPEEFESMSKLKLLQVLNNLWKQN